VDLGLRDEDAVLGRKIAPATRAAAGGRRGRGQPAAGGVVDRRRRVSGLHEVLEQLHRQRKDDGGVLLRRDGVERLQVAQLQRRGRFADDVRRLLERPRCLLLSLGCYHLTTDGQPRKLSKNTALIKRIRLKVMQYRQDRC